MMYLIEPLIGGRSGMKCLLLGVLCVSSFFGCVHGNGSGGNNGSETFKLKCYICSWSSTSNIENNIDRCSTHNFIPEAAATLPCEHGCQTVSYRHAKNEGLRHFYRNCLKVDKGVTPVDRCTPPKQLQAHGLETICECLTHLCNQSSYSHSPQIYVMGIGILLFLIFTSFPITPFS